MSSSRQSTRDALFPEQLGKKVAEIQPSAVARLSGSPTTTANADVKLPVVLQFPLAVALSVALSTLGSVVLSQVSRGDLASLTRSPETWTEMAVLAGWKIAELSLAWFGGLGSLEAAALNILAHGPAYYLLAAFYGLTSATAISALTVNVISIAAPFYMVLPLTTPDKHATQDPNRELVDKSTQLLTTLLSTAIHAVTLVLSLRFLMPRILVVYFNGLPTLEPAYSASYAHVFPITILFGLSSSIFMFSPFASAGEVKEDAEVKEFDPINASLGQTIRWNVWGYTAKEKVLIRRTATAAILAGINTYLACTKNMYGIEPTGAAAYASIWVTSIVLTGASLGFVGNA